MATAEATKLGVTWRGLTHCYSAPEAGALLAAVEPIESSWRAVAQRCEAVADALDRYVADLRPLMSTLDSLRLRAEAYAGVDTSSEVWRTIADHVRDHNHLMAQIDHTVAAWEEAERRCANAINAQNSAACYVPYRADDGNARHDAAKFGFTAAALDNAATHGGVPWGRSLTRAHAWTVDPGGALGQVAVGAGLAAWDFGRTITAIAIPQTDPQRATAVGRSTLALLLSANPAVRRVNQHAAFAGLPAGSITHAPEEAGKALISYDEWQENPDRALGANIFTALTFLGSDGAGAAARGVGVAARAGEASSAAAAGIRAVNGWRGEGLALDAYENAATNEVLFRARAAEPVLTHQLKALERESDHAELVGLDSRLKSEDSLKRKVAGLLVKKDLPASLDSVNDSVRYTFQVGTDHYAVEVQQLITRLREEWEPVSDRYLNKWKSKKGYMGINTSWRDPSSKQVFEVQFHTLESYTAKEVTHKLFEVARRLGTPAAAKAWADRTAEVLFSQVPRPAGASKIRLRAKQ